MDRGIIDDVTRTITHGIAIVEQIFKGQQSYYLVIAHKKNYGFLIPWGEPGDIQVVNRDDVLFNRLWADAIRIFVNPGAPYDQYGDECSTECMPITSAKSETHNLFVHHMIADGVAEWFDNEEPEQILSEVGYYEIALPECQGYKMFLKTGYIYQTYGVIEDD